MKRLNYHGPEADQPGAPQQVVANAALAAFATRESPGEWYVQLPPPRDGRLLRAAVISLINRTTWFLLLFVLPAIVGTSFRRGFVDWGLVIYLTIAGCLIVPWWAFSLIRFRHARRAAMLPSVMAVSANSFEINAAQMPYGSSRTFPRSSIVDVRFCGPRFSVETIDGTVTDFNLPWEGPVEERDLENRVRFALKLPGATPPAVLSVSE